jgi:membrane protease YdiL (CAAX protease family)
MRSWVRDHPIAFAVVGVVLAIGSTTVLDAVGFGLNVLPLIPLFFVCWYLQRLSRVEVGLVWGLWRDYASAILYPVLPLALVGVIAWASGAATLSAVSWGSTLLNLAAQIVVTTVLAIVTEEGIFRGWLWASLQRAGVAQLGVLVWTSLAFGLWHLSTALLPTAFHPALAQVPVYIANACVIGFIWALMRQRSGSIVVTSVSHGFWNGLVYVLFGYGTTLGVLGIRNTAVFGPEIGLVGLALNVAYAAVLWLTLSRGRAVQRSQAAVSGSRSAR